MVQTLAERLAVHPDQLRHRLDPAELPFTTTAEVAPLAGTIGQPRALEAIQFGLGIRTPGFHIFVSGAPGSGRTSTILDHLRRFAQTQPPPADWVYVYNFEAPDRPYPIKLPAGQGTRLARAMDEFLQAAQREIARAFESEEYERRRREALSEIERRRDDLIEGLHSFARERGFAVEMTPAGIVPVPLVLGRPLTPQQFEQLPPHERQALEQRAEEIHTQIAGVLRQLRQLEKAAAERIRQLDRSVALFAVGPLLDDIREEFKDNPAVLAYLDAVQRDIPEHIGDFRAEGGETTELPPEAAQMRRLQRQEHLDRYRINVLIDNSKTSGAPVIFERNPTYYNLAGRIDHRIVFGAMVTDFHQIRPGALQRANGGFLVLNALDVLGSPLAWQALKRALQSREVRIENLGEQYTPLPTVTLRPEPIPLDLKVVLIGQPLFYHLLYLLDEDFPELFRVKADFALDMDWTNEHVQNYAAFVSRCVRDSGLKHFDRTAVARIVEYGARLRDHQRKLSTQLREIGDLVAEASFWAGQAGHDLVSAEDVDQAIAKKEYRSNLLEERLQELITDGTILIDTVGSRVGQVNGISILDLGDYAFGRPVRITARVSLGRGTVQSIEREIELSGRIHSKGFLILTGYLAAKYAQSVPLAVAATITFEQSYDEVEGDSASAAELFTLLSALSELPLKQGIAVTGSVNQHGEVQAVGGVTKKIEGFFATCRAKGLTGEQGVIIPAANLPHLMLNDDVVEAVRNGMFHVWAIRNVDEGLELLTGQPAGERGPDGRYPEGSVHRRVEDRLHYYAEQSRRFAAAREMAGRGDGPLANRPDDRE